MSATAIVRPPGPRVAEGEVTHLERTAVDVERARAQHRTYVEVLRRHGLRIVEAPALDDHPDGLFVEDALVVLGRTAVLTRPGAPSRRGEVDSLVPVVAALGLRAVRIEGPGTLDGGDVLVTGRHVFVGRSTRTDDDGRAQLGPVAGPLGLDVVGIDVTRCLHLKSAVTALPDGSLVAVAGWLDLDVFRGLGYTVHETDEPSGGDVLCLGRTVVLPADAPATAARLRALGFAVEPVDVGELQKIEAGVTCMSVIVPARGHEPGHPARPAG